MARARGGMPVREARTGRFLARRRRMATTATLRFAMAARRRRARARRAVASMRTSGSG